MKYSNFNDIKTAKAKKIDALIIECKMFFAFSNEQFEANKTELKEGEKYVSIGAGAYLPKSQINNWIEGQKNVDKWYKNEIKKSKKEDEQILYELRNYECFYTNDIEDAYEVLKQYYTLDKVKEVFNKNRHLEEQF